MPARLDLTPEQLLARLERERALGRQRVARWRERRRNGNAVTVTALSSTRAPGVRSTRSLKEPSTTTYAEIDQRLGRFAARGYVSDPTLWQRLGEKYPDVDLVLAAIGMAEWLDRGANRKRRCSPGFITNWVKRSQDDPKPAARPARTSRYAEILALYGYDDAAN